MNLLKLILNSRFLRSGQLVVLYATCDLAEICGRKCSQFSCSAFSILNIWTILMSRGINKKIFSDTIMYIACFQSAWRSGFTRSPFYVSFYGKLRYQVLSRFQPIEHVKCLHGVMTRDVQLQLLALGNQYYDSVAFIVHICRLKR